MSPEVIGVKAFIEILNETLGFAYPSVTVEGEVHSFKVNQGKWVFFDLKDEDATLPCFMPVYQLKVPLEDGMKVRVSGKPTLTKWGKFSFTVRTVDLAGEGALRRAFEMLKARLEEEGLFATERKRQLPQYPRTIGLVASGQSAAYHDFIKILNQRWSGVAVQLADIQVQGTPAPAQVAAAIEYFNQLARPVDVIVIVRGGGSLEDLQAFNTEQVARAVAGSRTPTVVGVGHEIDVSLADFAADVRAATPTDAARLVVPDRREVGAALGHQEQAMARSVERLVTQQRHRLERAFGLMERYLHRPLDLLVQLQWRLTEAQVRAQRQAAEQLGGAERLLASYNPIATLRRGYAIVWQGKQVVKNRGVAQLGSSAVIQLADGKIDATLEKHHGK